MDGGLEMAFARPAAQESMRAAHPAFYSPAYWPLPLGCNGEPRECRVVEATRSHR